MFCAISGNAPENPVVSKATGHVYERSILEKYIDAEGKCPMTGAEMTMDDAVEVQANKAVRPRPITATSIPGMLTLFQDEWDTLMLETHELKQHLDTVRQELAKTLYQHDAACRVIAKLVTERDQARAMCAQMKAAADAAPPPAEAKAMETEEAGGISQKIKDEMVAKFDALQTARKSRPKKHEALASVDSINGYGEKSSSPVHGTGKPGVSCMVLDPKNQDLLLSGGVDGSVVLFNKTTGKVVESFNAHSKAVTDVQVHAERDVLFSTSKDKTACMYVGEGGKFSKSVIKAHSAAVVGCAIHPTGNYVVTASMDSTWVLHDLSQGKPRALTSITDSNVTKGFSAVSFHPDGIYLGTGSSQGLVQVFDIRTQKGIANLKGANDHTDAVNSMSFSENGYYLATGSEDGSAIVWDLRKLKNTKKYALKAPVNKVQFDYTGVYLAIASDTVNVYRAKKWDAVATLDGHKGAVSSVTFGTNAQWLATSGMDRTIKVWGA